MAAAVQYGVVVKQETANSWEESQINIEDCYSSSLASEPANWEI